MNSHIWSPPWEFAPEWALFAAFSIDGSAYWFEHMPEMRSYAYIGFPVRGASCRIGEVRPVLRDQWRNSLEFRPEDI